MVISHSYVKLPEGISRNSMATFIGHLWFSSQHWRNFLAPEPPLFRGPRTLSFRFTTKELEVGEIKAANHGFFPWNLGLSCKISGKTIFTRSIEKVFFSAPRNIMTHAGRDKLRNTFFLTFLQEEHARDDWVLIHLHQYSYCSGNPL